MSAHIYAHSSLGAFAFYFPKHYISYAELRKTLLARHPGLRYPFDGSPFAAQSTNYSRRAVTYEHTDCANKADGICPIFCSGDFDPTKGGHLILRELNLLIEFPPGAFIFIPSAILLHGNVDIAPGEQRESFTQFTAGGLFR
ncbi:hypothetical protein BC835DRAFT_1278302 [Cytidiella melzeri]|nr:hypothetical protein BC835DRAFT_1278302 [Cytidiella melzeri]